MKKQELINLGFECRNGHSTLDITPLARESNNTEGKHFSFIIIHKNRPEIKHITGSIDLELNLIITLFGFETEESPAFLSSQFILGWSETEEDAWDSAISFLKQNETKLEDILNVAISGRNKFTPSFKRITN